jgi:putative transposase
LSHSYAQNHVHLVFSTKNRLKIIPKKLQPRLWSYTAAICKNHDILAFAVGGMDDHIHILFRLPPTITLSRVVTLIKSNTSKWIKEQGIRFSWQEGYGAFSVSSSNVSAVIKYIDNQEAHHRKMTFEQEFIALLKKHGVEFDPRYVLG